MKQKILNLIKSHLAHQWFRKPSRNTKIIGIIDSQADQTAQYLQNILKQSHSEITLVTRKRQIQKNKELDETFQLDFKNGISAFSLQKTIREISYRGSQYTLLEIDPSSLFKQVYRSIKFEILIIGNDINISPEIYQQKDEFIYYFLPLIRKCPLCVLSKDNPLYPYLIHYVRQQKTTFSRTNQAQVESVKEKNGAWGSFFYFINRQSPRQGQLSLDRSVKLKNTPPENISSALSAIAAAVNLQIPDFKIKQGLEDYPLVV